MTFFTCPISLPSCRDLGTPIFVTPCRSVQYLITSPVAYPLIILPSGRYRFLTYPFKTPIYLMNGHNNFFALYVERGISSPYGNISFKKSKRLVKRASLQRLFALSNDMNALTEQEKYTYHTTFHLLSPMAIVTHGMRSFRCSRTGVMMVPRSWPVQTSRGMGGDTAPFVPIPERRRVVLVHRIVGVVKVAIRSWCYGWES
ncbi:hypothetical protein LXL04_013985 [Taraxacum kok-saghyz]